MYERKSPDFSHTRKIVINTIMGRDSIHEALSFVTHETSKCLMLDGIGHHDSIQTYAIASDIADHVASDNCDHDVMTPELLQDLCEQVLEMTLEEIYDYYVKYDCDLNFYRMMLSGLQDQVFGNLPVFTWKAKLNDAGIIRYCELSDLECLATEVLDCVQSDYPNDKVQAVWMEMEMNDERQDEKIEASDLPSHSVDA